MTRINPLDIRKKTFDKRTFGGYSKDDVDGFLQNLSQAWQESNADKDRLETELSMSRTELDRMRSLETSLLQGLHDAKQVSQLLLEQSRKEADLIVYEAQVKANQFLSDAKQQARMMVQEANQQAYQALIAMRAELKQLDQDFRNMEKQRDFLLSELRQFVNETSQKLDRVESHRRTVSYNEEITKANVLMQQNNEAVKNYLKESVLQTNAAPQRVPAVEEMPKSQETQMQTQTQTQSYGNSFFDMI
jgi:cell division initiation protein